MNKGIAFLNGSLFDLESTSTEQRRFTADAEEFSRTNSESNVLSRFGAMFFEYLYSMDIESDDESSYYESTPAVREESHQRIIMGPSTIEITSGVFHRMEMVMKLSEDDANLRKGIDLASICCQCRQRITTSTGSKSSTHYLNDTIRFHVSRKGPSSGNVKSVCTV